MGLEGLAAWQGSPRLRPQQWMYGHVCKGLQCCILWLHRIQKKACTSAPTTWGIRPVEAVLLLIQLKVLLCNMISGLSCCAL